MAPRTLLCFGDSNTHGSRAMHHMGDQRRHAPRHRWPSVMAGILGDGWSVIEEGHPGRTTVHDDPIEGTHKNGLRSLPVALESHRPVDLVILMLGTNDLKMRFALPPIDIARGVERLGREVLTSAAGPDQRAPGLLLVSPVPIAEAGVLGPMFVDGARKARALAPLIQEVAERLRVPFLDAGRYAKADPVDGIHLTAKAQKAIGAAMAEAVAAEFPRKG